MNKIKKVFKYFLLLMEVIMINKLKYTLDFQRFSPNSRLSAMIDDVERRYVRPHFREISDDGLFFVSAAGESYRMDDGNDNPNRNVGQK